MRAEGATSVGSVGEPAVLVVPAPGLPLPPPGLLLPPPGLLPFPPALLLPPPGVTDKTMKKWSEAPLQTLMIEKFPDTGFPQTMAESQTLGLKYDYLRARMDGLDDGAARAKIANDAKGETIALTISEAEAATLAHGMENLLDRLYEKTAALTPDVVRLLAATSDALDESIDGASDPAALRATIGRLLAEYEGPGAATPAAVAGPVPADTDAPEATPDRRSGTDRRVTGQVLRVDGGQLIG